MKLLKWEKDLCKAFVNMYKAKDTEINVNKWLEYEVSKAMDDMNGVHRQLIEDYLLTLVESI